MKLKKVLVCVLVLAFCLQSFASEDRHWTYVETTTKSGAGSGYVENGSWKLTATRAKNTSNLTVKGADGEFKGDEPAPMDFTVVKSEDGSQSYRVVELTTLFGRYVNKALYDYAEKLTELVAPDCIKLDTGGYNFNRCANLTKVVLNDEYNTEIPSAAFSGCTSLSSFSPRILKCSLIKGEAFKSCAALTGRFYFPECASFGSNSFNGSGIEEVSAPKATVIQASSFQACVNLSRVTVSEELSFVGSSAFKGCTGLDPDFLETFFAGKSNAGIGTSAFEGCSSLTGPFVWNIGGNCVSNKAFYNCSALASIVFKKPIDEFQLLSLDGIKPGAALYMHSTAPSVFARQALASSNKTGPYPRIFLQDNFEEWIAAFSQYHHVILKADFNNEEFESKVEANTCSHKTRTRQQMVAQMVSDEQMCTFEKTADGKNIATVTMRQKGVIGFMMYHMSTHAQSGCWIMRKPEQGLLIIVK